MKVSKSGLRMTAGPVLYPILERLIQNEARRVLGNGPADMVDNSGGTPAANLVAVPTPSKHSYVSGATLAPRAAWNTNIALVDDAIAVIGKYLNDEATQASKLGVGSIVANATGAVAEAGTVAAITATLTGTDGAGNTALLQSQAADQVTKVRNNLSTIVRAYNSLAQALGAATLEDRTGGKADQKAFVLVDVPDATTATGNTGVVVSLADANAILAALRNDIATIVAKINTVLFPAGVTGAKVPIVLVP